MALPTTRTEFKALCIRRLGGGAINIDVTDDQIDDCVDLALDFFRDYHYDGSFHTYYKHQVTDQDKINKYIDIPENVFGAVRVFPVGQGISSSDGLFSIQYQIALNDLYTLTSTSIVPYYMSMQHLELFSQVLVGENPFRFSRHRNRLYLDINWNKINVGQYFLVDAYEVMDPNEFTDVWSDRWLIKYATALIKKQWGNNLKKFTGVALVGGVQYSGQQIYDEANDEVASIEADVLSSSSEPLGFFTG